MRKENVFVKNLKKITQLPFYAHHVRLLTGVVIYGTVLAMDKLTAVSGILFLVADIFAIASLAHPEWIVSDVAGKNEDGRTLSVCTGLCILCTCTAMSVHLYSVCEQLQQLSFLVFTSP